MVPLITGGCGFIGSHLVESYTEAGDSVMVLDDLSSGTVANLVHPASVRLTTGDIADEGVVAPLVAQASVVYHLAAIASVAVCTNEPTRAHHTNIIGTQVIFDAVAAAQRQTGRSIPVVYASSAAIYGDNPTIPLNESSHPAPINLYGEQKLENERIATRAYNESGVRSVGLRFFNVYGPRQDPSSPYSGVISKFVDAAKTDRTLTIFGDGEQTRDFIYVRDVVVALQKAAAWARGADVFNVCTGRATDLKQLASLIGTALGGHDLPVAYQRAREGDIRHSLGDASALTQAFHVKDWTPLLTGLQETFA